MDKPTRKRMLSRWMLPFSVCALLCLLIILVLEFSFAQRTRFSPEAIVDLNRHEARSNIIGSCDGQGEHCLRVAIAPVISPEKSIEAYYDLVKYLGQKTGQKTKLLTGADYSDVNNLMRYKLCDLALVCTYSYVLGADRGDMELLAIPRVFGETSYHSYVIARRDGGFHSLADLRGQVFASSDVLSTSGWLYPMAWLKNQSIDVESFFSRHLISGSHDRSIRAVAEGMADAAAVDSLVYRQLIREDPSITNTTEIIQTSEPFGMPPIVVSPDYPARKKQRVLTVLTTMHDDPAGRKIMDELAVERFSVADPSMYRSVRDLITKWESRQ